MRVYGLVGRNIGYSRSAALFSEKFSRAGITDAAYRNFDIPHIEKIRDVWETRGLSGLNVTTPYKEAIRSYLDRLSPRARQIGAVNVIEFKAGQKIGHNTDAYGFEHSLRPLLSTAPIRALILGTGGASSTVAFVLEKLGIPFAYVSRSQGGPALSYGALTAETISTHLLIVNCTPLGTHPQIHSAPDIPYEVLSPDHLVYDLVYEPAATTFMKRALARGARVKNGYPMLRLQAERAWEIWNRAPSA